MDISDLRKNILKQLEEIAQEPIEENNDSTGSYGLDQDDSLSNHSISD
jgi:hypothetical protein